MAKQGVGGIRTSTTHFCTALAITERAGIIFRTCLLYTYDAAADLPCVDLIGPPIIKNKNLLETQTVQKKS